jgi:polyphenol oxidase
VFVPASPQYQIAPAKPALEPRARARTSCRVGCVNPHGVPTTHYTFPSLEKVGVPHLTTTRHCRGVTPSNLATGPFDDAATALLRGAGIEYSRLAWARQVHGSSVARVGPDGGPHRGDGFDVLVTTERGVGLSIFTADCLAITLVDRDAGALSVCHAGWRGTARDVPGTAVAALRELGAIPARMHATIAPSIGPCCYEVDEPVTRDLAAAFPDLWARWITPVRPGHVMLDLWTANEDLLARAGVDPARIENARTCTACHRDVLYSYRKGDRGRLVTVAALP